VLPNEKDREAAANLRSSRGSDQFIEDTLTTNDRVIARVTDGIYRQPGSAIRELIANAYDADATWVSVKTDAPLFSRITVEDNGSGMTPESVIHLLHNIGGSAKRTEQGKSLGLASADDLSVTPGGRKLIGKLGIGMFSVSQLTHSFQIVTKTKDDDYRTVVLVNLRQFSDEPVAENEADFRAGSYQVWRESAPDTNIHGTTITLTAIRPQTREALQSRQLWNAIDHPVVEDGAPSSRSLIPLYHIGRLGADGIHVDDPKAGLSRLPWRPDDSPTSCFRSMVDAVWAVAKGRTGVKLDEIFDSYLQMVWNLSLSLPLPYVDRNVLDEPIDDEWAYIYRLSNERRGSATPVTTSPDKCVRSVLDLDDTSPELPFEVTIDGIALRRPLKFRDLPTTQHVLKKPMMFLGRLNEEFTGFDRDVSAGPLRFHGYLFWTPKVAPTEHQGVLVRIHGSSGTLFDSTFFNYQVAELTRLRQITCEIFVTEGLEAALNIDRESFNTSHPHTVVLTNWVHSAVRQLATAQKREAQQLRERKRAEGRAQVADVLSRVVDTANRVRSDGEGVIPEVMFNSVSTPTRRPTATLDDTQVFDVDELRQAADDNRLDPPSNAVVAKLEAITKVLNIYGVIEDLAPAERSNLLGSILAILEAE
jgi:hypothetical protein